MAQDARQTGASGHWHAANRINTLFIDHLQNMGKGHFIVRRLESAHGAGEVKRIDQKL